MAVEPLYPQVCQRVPVLVATRPDLDGPSPIELSRSLNSIACSLSVKREDPIAIYHLVMEVMLIGAVLLYFLFVFVFTWGSREDVYLGTKRKTFVGVRG